MKIKVTNTKDVPFDGVKCVVYGVPGSGKTRLCATAPKPIIISAERGLLSLSDQDVDFIEILTMDDLDAAYRYLKGNGGDKYETICLDSLSEIAEVIIASIKPDFKDARQAYGYLADVMLPMLRKFRDLKGKNTLFTAKLISKTDEESGKVTEEILMPGRVLGVQIPYMVDELFKLNVDRKNVSSIQTAPDRISYAKDRSGALAIKEDNLDMTYIINKIKAKCEGGDKGNKT